MGHSFVSCAIHCIFSTKERRSPIPSDVQDRLWSYMGGIARSNNMTALAVGGTDNHAHMLLSVTSTIPISKAMQLVKGGSSKWLRDTLPQCHDFCWQEGYGAFGVSQSMIPQTISYIGNQKDHHHTATFEEEFTAFLRKHGIDYDPQYVFG